MNTELKLAHAYTTAILSPDRSNSNGAVVYEGDILLGYGYNHSYPGVPWTDERPAKYERVVHAEADACLSLIRNWSKVTPETTMFAPWAACKSCAITILGSGIKHLVIHYERCLAFEQTRVDQNEFYLQDWQPAIDESAKWLKDGGVTIDVFRGPVPFDGTIQVNGRPWSPSKLEFTDAQ